MHEQSQTSQGKLELEVKALLKKLLVFHSNAANLFKVHDVSAMISELTTSKNTKYLSQVVVVNTLYSTEL